MEYKRVEEYVRDVRRIPGNEVVRAQQIELDGERVLYVVKEARGRIEPVCRGMIMGKVRTRVIVFGYLNGISWIPFFKSVRAIEPEKRVEIESKLLEKLAAENPARRIDGVAFFDKI